MTSERGLSAPTANRKKPVEAAPGRNFYLHQTVYSGMHTAQWISVPTMRWNYPALMMRAMLFAAALFAGGIGGCSQPAIEKQGSVAAAGLTGVDGDAKDATEAPLKILFHIRPVLQEGGFSSSRGLFDAWVFCSEHPTAQVIVIVDDRAFNLSAYAHKRISTLCASGARVEFYPVYQPPNFPVLEIPPCVNQTKEVHVRIAELVKEGWTYIAL